MLALKLPCIQGKRGNVTNCIDCLCQKGGSLPGPQNCEINHPYLCCCHHYPLTASQQQRPYLSALLWKVSVEFSLHLTIHNFCYWVIISGTVPSSAKEQIHNIDFAADERDFRMEASWVLEFLKSQRHRMLAVLSLAQFHHHLFHEETESQKSYIIYSNLYN